MGKERIEIPNKQENSAIRIRSIQAASLYRVNNDYKFVPETRSEDGSDSGVKEYREPFLECGNAVISKSFFAKYVSRHGAALKN